MVETAVRAAAGRVPVIVGVSSGTPAASIALRGRRRGGRRRRDHAAAAARLPRRPARDRRVLPRGGRRVRRCRSWPTTTPRRAGPTCPSALIARLAAEVDAVVAIKECSGDARRIAALLSAAPDLEVLVGGDDWALEGFCAGATGWVTGVGRLRAGRVRRALRRLPRRRARPGARGLRAAAPARAARHDARSSSSTSRRAQDAARLHRRAGAPAAAGARRGRHARCSRPRSPRCARRSPPERMRAARSIAAVDSHTEGMPTRVVTGGVGADPGRDDARARAALRGASWTTCGCC